MITRNRGASKKHSKPSTVNVLARGFRGTFSVSNKSAKKRSTAKFTITIEKTSVPQLTVRVLSASGSF